MKQSNATSIFFGAAVVILLNFSSCGTFEDGPEFTLRTKQSRLLGEWIVEKIDHEKPDDGEIELEFEKDGDFKFTQSYSYDGYFYAYSYKGEWDWDKDKEAVEIYLLGEQMNWSITRLTNSELWFEDQDTVLWECEIKK